MGTKEKQEPFKVGDRFWLETIWRFDNKPRQIIEFIVVEVNKTSAYAVKKDRLEDYKKSGGKRFKARFLQRNRKLATDYSFDVTYIVWNSIQEFKKDSVRYRQAKAQ